MARFGDATALILADVDLGLAQQGAQHVNQLLDTEIVRPAKADGLDEASLVRLLEPVDAALSAVPYRFNVGFSRVVIAVYAMSLMDKPRSVTIWVGGLPQNPCPPLDS